MSKYTTELRYICEMAAGLTESKGYDDVEDIVTSAAPHIFNNFAIFDEQYRLTLEKKILMHYYTREICEETVGLWKLRLATRMNEIMPIFNKLYETELLKYNPFYDVDYTIQRENNGTQIGTNKGTKESDANRTNTNLENAQSITENDFTTSEQTDEQNTSKANTENSKANTSTVDTQNKGTAISNGGTSTTVQEDTDTTTRGTSAGQNSGTTHVLSDGSSNRDTDTVTDNTDSQVHWDMYSDTPQGTIRDIGISDSDHNYYLTNAREKTDTDTFHSHVVGNDDEVHEDESTTTNTGSNSITNNETTEVSGKTKTDAQTNDLTSTTSDGKTVSNSLDNGSSVSNKTDTVDRTTEKSTEGTQSTKGQTSTVGNESTKDLTKTDFLNTLNTTDEYTERVFGKRGSVSYTKMLMELRDSFINIDEMIINKLSDLFFGLW